MCPWLPGPKPAGQRPKQDCEGRQGLDEKGRVYNAKTFEYHSRAMEIYEIFLLGSQVEIAKLQSPRVFLRFLMRSHYGLPSYCSLVSSKDIHS